MRSMFLIPASVIQRSAAAELLPLIAADEDAQPTAGRGGDEEDVRGLAESDDLAEVLDRALTLAVLHRERRAEHVGEELCVVRLVREQLRDGPANGRRTARRGEGSRLRIGEREVAPSARPSCRRSPGAVAEMIALKPFRCWARSS